MFNSHVKLQNPLPSGKLTVRELEHGHLVRGFTYEKIVIFHSYVSLPEGNLPLENMSSSVGIMKFPIYGKS